MEACLRGLLPKLLVDRATFGIYPFMGKPDLFEKLPKRLRGYATWLPPDWRIVIVVDRDQDDCAQLKSRIDEAIAGAGLMSKTSANAGQSWSVVSRFAIEELEAWYFGDWAAVRQSYPRVNPNVPQQAKYRNPDAIAGGTWEALERVLQAAGYFKSGLRKIELARTLGVAMNAADNRSPSFAHFRDALLEAIGTPATITEQPLLR